MTTRTTMMLDDEVNPGGSSAGANKDVSLGQFDSTYLALCRGQGIALTLAPGWRQAAPAPVASSDWRTPAASRLRRRYGLDETTAKLVVELSGLGGRQ